MNRRTFTLFLVVALMGITSGCNESSQTNSVDTILDDGGPLPPDPSDMGGGPGDGGGGGRGGEDRPQRPGLVRAIWSMPTWER